MKYSVELKESAKDDIIEAFLYYEDKLQGLGERFLIAWERQLEFLREEPQLFQKKYKDFRQAAIKKFPYHIIYEIELTSIIIYKVIYAGRHPRKRYTKSEK